MGNKLALVADISKQSAELTAGFLESAGFDVLFASDGMQAYELCIRYLPEVVVTDAILPYVDGAGLAAKLRMADMPFRPGIVICAHPGFLRVKPATGVCSIEKPVEEAALLHAMCSVDIASRQPSDAFISYSGDILDALGIPEHTGRSCLIDAVFLACEDRRLISALTARLYPLVASRSGLDATAVERAMRHVIDKAWTHGNIEKQYEIFKGTIDAAKGKPTCGAMIARLSELVRMEV